MNKKTMHCCNTMDRVLNENKAHVGYAAQYREYYIDARNEPIIIYQIYYCPWCNKQLPKDLRDEWFEVLETEYHLDDPWSHEQEKLVPQEFKTDEWWIKRGL
jgi:hypothetical protein